MATSTLVQFLQPGEGAKTLNRAQEETFLAGGSITAGDAVALDTSKTGADRALYVVQAPVNSGALVVGVALSGATAGQNVTVAVTGYVGSANVETGVAAGQALYVGATGGRLAAISNAATATSAVFLSAPVTGNGSPQNTAHGLGVVPDLIIAIPDDLTPATTGAYAITYGTHTSTNAIVTATSGKIYRVAAFRLAAADKALGAVAGPVAVALGAESGNLAPVFMLKRGF